MKRLLICTPTHTLHGGVERIIESLADRLPDHGYDVLFALARGSRFNDPDRFRAEYPRIRSVEIDGTSGTAEGRRRSLRAVIEHADPDIVLMARLFDLYPVIGRLKREGHRARLAVTIQAYEAEYFIDARRYRDFIDACVASGKLAAAAAVSISGIPAERVTSIPGGVARPRRFRIPSDVLRLGYVGRIETAQKRALDLAELLDELRSRGVPFTCVVAGTGSQEDELKRRAGTDVLFHGWVDVQTLYNSIYPEIDVFLHFAEWEGITIAPREAMAHGSVPVISRFKGLLEEEQFVDGINALTFPVGDIRAAADHVERLHRDRALLERLSAAARASQTGVRSEAGAATAWAKAFDDALARQPRIGELPPLPRAHGRLDRFLPPAAAESLRRLMRRRFVHGDPGSEWPHWSGQRDEEVAARLDALANAVQ